LRFDACLAHFDYRGALAEKGQSGTFDTSRLLRLSLYGFQGQSREKGFGEDKGIEIMMQYRTA
jgi:hypothetical protein